jgi:hypothetical protein
MGGYGSGRSGWRPKAEGTQRLDVRYLNGRGMLEANRYSTLTWSRGGEPSGDIKLVSYGNKLVLNYRAKSAYEDEWTKIEEDVYLDWTPCNFGGKRPWLLCPRCRRRVALIYSVGKRFLCRHCYRITYSSQCESLHDRLLRKSRKIRKKLEAGVSIYEPVMFKPKGMHQTTFDRLHSDLMDTDDTILALTMMRFGLTRFW